LVRMLQRLTGVIFLRIIPDQSSSGQHWLRALLPDVR
jgi:hypothetical protein